MKELATGHPDWIPESELPDHPLGWTVGSALPSDFPAYAKLLHPLYRFPPEWAEQRRAEAIAEISENLPPDEVDKLLNGAEIYIGRGYDDYPPLAERESWAEWCRRFGIPYTSEFDPIRLQRQEGWPGELSTDEGAPGFEFIACLCEHLKQIGVTGPCGFDYRMHRLEDDSGPPYLEGTLDDLLAYLQAESSPFIPTYMWPQSREWCTYSDYDSSFTLVAGPEELVERLLGDNRFDALKVTPDTVNMVRTEPLTDEELARSQDRALAVWGALIEEKPKLGFLNRLLRR